MFDPHSEWVGLSFELLPKRGTEYAKKLSHFFHTYSFNFLYAEDHGWQYELFYNGDRVGKLEVNFETLAFSDVKSANTILLKQLAMHTESIIKMEHVFAQRTLDLEDLHRSVRYFQEGFGLELLHPITYEYFASLSETKRKHMNVHYFGQGKKKIDLEKVLHDECKELLQERGYYYSQRDDDYAFVSVVDGFEYGLKISKAYNLKRIEPRLFTPMAKGINMYYAQKKYLKEFEYKNEAELRQSIKEICQTFLTFGDSWLKANRIKIFNANDLYDLQVDDFMKKHSYLRIKADENILFGGEMVYQGEKGTVVFKHFPQLTSVTLFATLDGQTIRLINYLLEHEKINRSDLKNIRSGFQNEEEFKIALKHAFDLLEIYFGMFWSKQV